MELKSDKFKSWLCYLLAIVLIELSSPMSCKLLFPPEQSVSRQILVKRQPRRGSDLYFFFYKKHKDTVIEEKKGKENTFQVATMYKVLYILNKTGQGFRGVCSPTTTSFCFTTSGFHSHEYKSQPR